MNCKNCSREMIEEYPKKHYACGCGYEVLMDSNNNVVTEVNNEGNQS